MANSYLFACVKMSLSCPHTITIEQVGLKTGPTIIFLQPFAVIYLYDVPAYVVAEEILIVYVVIHIDNYEFILLNL